MCGQISSTHLGLLSADAYMRSQWQEGGHGRGVTLLGWMGNEEREEEEGKGRRDGKAEGDERDHS